jgi:hypothetical protein
VLNRLSFNKKSSPKKNVLLHPRTEKSLVHVLVYDQHDLLSSEQAYGLDWKNGFKRQQDYIGYSVSDHYVSSSLSAKIYRKFLIPSCYLSYRVVRQNSI